MDFAEPTPEEHLGRMIGRLPPAPDAWTAAAREIPLMLRSLEAVQARMLDDAEARADQTAQLEAALEQAGLSPTPKRVSALQRRLERGSGEL